jgi:co-chaperonin GroES (HSP10)
MCEQGGSQRTASLKLFSSELHHSCAVVCEQVKPGDRILYFKWAGDTIEAAGGSYVVLHEVDILAKV